MYRQRVLKGMRVLDFTRYLPGPYATMRLADMGAEVIKVEDSSTGDLLRSFSISGEEPSLLFRMLNRNKRSVAVDLRREEGQSLMRRLVVDADVVVESYRPGVMARWGLDVETMQEENPRLIYCSLTGYGQGGGMTSLAGHDLNYIGLAGLLDGIGSREGPPVVPSVQIADLAGGLAASEQILAAWIRRLRTGEGTFLDLSMTDVLHSWHAYALAVEQEGGSAARGSHVLGGGIVAYNVYQTAEGGYMALGALEPKFWDRFCEAVERPEWKGRGLTPVWDSGGLQDEVTRLFLTRTREEWTRLGEEADCCLTPVLSALEAARSPLAVERKGYFPERVASSSLLLPNGGTLVAEGPGPAVSPAPELGEDTEEILAEAGVSKEAIVMLKEAGVVAGKGNQEPPLR